MSAESRSFESADETRAIGKGQVQIVKLGAQSIGLARMEPGWKWSNDVKPIVGGDSCQGDHLGYAVSGSLHVVTDDGSEMDINPGQVYAIKPGHDGWVNGDEPFVGVEFQSQTVEAFGKAD